MKKIFLFLLLLITIETVFSKSYLYNIKLTKEKIPLFIKLTKIYKIDIWKDGIPINSNFNFLIKKEVKEKVEESLNLLNIPFEIQKNFNLENLIEKEKKNLNSNETNFFKKFHTYSEYEIWLNSIINLYPNLTEKISIGKSFENREIFGIKITKKTNFKKSSIVITSGMHSREWAAITTSFWIIFDLLKNSETKTKFLLETIEWHFIPIVNPDGFIYTLTTDRLWRKSRSINSGSNCIGTDMNRNWDFQWNSGGSSTDPCSEIYRGSNPNSEIEVKGLVDYISSLSNVKVYFDIHSFSQLIMRPYGYSKLVPPDEIEMSFINNKISQNITNTFSKFYQPGRISVVIYEASGSGVDWCYGNKGIFSFAAEVRPQFIEEGGFLLPADQIIPTGQEMMNGIIEMGKYFVNYTLISNPNVSPIVSKIKPINSNQTNNTTYIINGSNQIKFGYLIYFILILLLILD